MLKYGVVIVPSTNQEESTIKWHKKLDHMLECGLKILVECNHLPKLIVL